VDHVPALDQEDQSTDFEEKLACGVFYHLVNWLPINYEGLSIDVVKLAVLHKDTAIEARVALLGLPLDGVAVGELAVVLPPRRRDYVLIHLIVVDEALRWLTGEARHAVEDLKLVVKLLYLFEFWRHENGLRLCCDQVVPVFKDIIVEYTTFEECLLRLFQPPFVWDVFEKF